MLDFVDDNDVNYLEPKKDKKNDEKNEEKSSLKTDKKTVEEKIDNTTVKSEPSLIHATTAQVILEKSAKAYATGKMGIAITTSSDLHQFDILIYENGNKLMAISKIYDKFPLNYFGRSSVSFPTNNKEIITFLKFDSYENYKEWIQLVCFIKYLLNPSVIVTQDLKLSKTESVSLSHISYKTDFSISRLSDISIDSYKAKNNTQITRVFNFETDKIPKVIKEQILLMTLNSSKLLIFPISSLEFIPEFLSINQNDKLILLQIEISNNEIVEKALNQTETNTNKKDSLIARMSKLGGYSMLNVMKVSPKVPRREGSTFDLIPESINETPQLQSQISVVRTQYTPLSEGTSNILTNTRSHISKQNSKESDVVIEEISPNIKELKVEKSIDNIEEFEPDEVYEKLLNQGLNNLITENRKLKKQLNQLEKNQTVVLFEKNNIQLQLIQNKLDTLLSNNEKTKIIDEKFKNIEKLEQELKELKTKNEQYEIKINEFTSKEKENTSELSRLNEQLKLSKESDEVNYQQEKSNLAGKLFGDFLKNVREKLSVCEDIDKKQTIAIIKDSIKDIIKNL